MSDVEVEIEADAWLSALPNSVALVTAAADAALHGADDASVTVLLADDAVVRALNRDHRRQDKTTNVLAFPAHASAVGHLGDLALAYETCAREATEQGKPLADHLRHLVVHGVLHLTGWDHEVDADADAMEAHERTVLAGLGVPDPYAS
jgi:probable rRNA maturation factor